MPALSVVNHPHLTTRPFGSCGKAHIGLLLWLLTALLTAAVGAGWYWLQRPLSAEMEAAENALFDSELVVIGLAEVEKMVTLEKLWFGAADPDALPIDEQQAGVLRTLFSGPARLDQNLHQALFAIHVRAAEQPKQRPEAHSSLLLRGEFNQQVLIDALADAYQLELLRPGLWSANRKPAAESESDPKQAPLCPRKDDAAPAQPKTFTLWISRQWLLIADNRDRAEQLWQRLQSGQSNQSNADIASQARIKRWRDYRRGRLVSLMALVPDQLGPAIGGVGGMIAHGVSRDTPQLTAIAASIAIAPLQAGVVANLQLASNDSDWNQKTETSIRQTLTELRQDSRAVSSTLASVIARISVASQTDAVELNMRLDSALLDDIDTLFKDGISDLMSMVLSGKPSNKPAGTTPAEVIDPQPKQYPPFRLTGLPSVNTPDHQPTPLLVKPPFTLDINSIQPNKQGQLELWMSAKMGLPDNSDGRFNGPGKFSLRIDAVYGRSGQQLLADERCLSANDLSGRSPNHQPESNNNHHPNEAWVWKHIRLKPDVAVADIATITGQLSFTVPAQVNRFELPLRAGETIEAADMRFYLSRVQNDSISYQLSGDSSNLLEVRALNQNGQVLRHDWKMQSGDNGRITQQFQGTVAAIELYIADRWFSQQAEFSVSELFVPTEQEASNAPRWLAPAHIDSSQWQDYAGLNLDRLQIDPKKDWSMWGKAVEPVAEASWPAMRVFITHKPAQWGNNPIAHLYLPMLADLPGVLSALSYQIDDPAAASGAAKRYVRVSYPYYSKSGEIVDKRQLDGRSIAVLNFPLSSGLKEMQTLTRLKGQFTVLLPQQTRSTRIPLKDLWQGQTVDGVTVTLDQVSRGMFPGYSLKVAGDLDKLVNLHGLSASGERISAAPINFQDDGYWTLTLPFVDGMQQLELITATEQQRYQFPFDLTPDYSQQ